MCVSVAQPAPSVKAFYKTTRAVGESSTLEKVFFNLKAMVQTIDLSTIPKYCNTDCMSWSILISMNINHDLVEQCPKNQSSLHLLQCWEIPLSFVDGEDFCELMVFLDWSASCRSVQSTKLG